MKEVKYLLVNRGKKYASYVSQYFKKFKVAKFTPKPTSRSILKDTERRYQKSQRSTTAKSYRSHFSTKRNR